MSQLPKSLLNFKPNTRSPASNAPTQNARCQKCLLTGHWTADCPNTAVYKSRPTRSQLLKHSEMKLPETTIKMDNELKEERKTAARDILAGRSFDDVDSDDADQMTTMTGKQMKEEMQESELPLHQKLVEFNQQHVDDDDDRNASSSYESDSSYESNPDGYFLDDSALTSAEKEEGSVPDCFTNMK